MFVFQQISETLSILRNDDVDEDNKEVHQQVADQKWYPLHNNQYIIRDEFSPFPLSGTSVVETKDGFFIYGGVIRFGKYAQGDKMYCVKNIDWSEMSLMSGSGGSSPTIDTAPTPRAYHTLTMVSDSRAILYGGQMESRIRTHYDPDLYEFAHLSSKHGVFTCRKLTEVRSMALDVNTNQFIDPNPRSHHAACSIRDDELYIFGGLASSGWRSIALGDLWKFDCKSRTWMLVSSEYVKVQENEQIHQPAPRYGHIMVGSKKHGKLYLIGGCNNSGEPIKEISSFDVRTGQWFVRFVLSFTNDRRTTCGVLPSSIIVTAQLKNVKPEDADVYISQQNKIVISSIPARYGSASMFDDFIFITGGETLDNDASPVLNDVLVYNVVTSKLLKCNIPCPETYISHHSSIIRNGKIILFGGVLGWNRDNSAHMAPITSLVQYPVFNLPLKEASKIEYIQQKQRIGSTTPTSPKEVTTPTVPHIVSVCCDYLLHNATYINQLFEAIATREQIVRLRLHFEHGSVINRNFLQNDIDCTPHSVSQLLLEYMDRIPDSLMTTKLYRDWIDAYTHNEDKIVLKDIYKDLLEMMPKEHLDTLKMILYLLNQLVNDTKNNTTADQLARLWSHTLLKTNVMSKYSVKDDSSDGKGMSPIDYVVSYMITHYELFF
ncbi:negative regulator of sporulation PMD1 [Acrasis kona]|uniref:Negative regulator of sporulation PMD1 n=1 Tax=Acrasis kona TaxID=1008807 RepID=A0AAW2ZCA1_9EUKA